MRNIVLLLLLCGAAVFAQDDTPNSINDFNFESISNPAFILLDETPSALETPDNLKSLSLYLSNGFSNSNIALEVNPYWILRWDKEDTSYEMYRGLMKDKNGNTKLDPFKKLKTNSSISLGYLDKKFEGFAESKKVIALGGRFTIFEYYDAKRIEKLGKVLTDISGNLSNPTLVKFDNYVNGPVIDLSTPAGEEFCDPFTANGTIPQEYIAAANTFFTNFPETAAVYNTAAAMLKAYFKENCDDANAFIFNTTNIKPTFRLDGAVGYSWLYKENDFNSGTANRFGSWLTADVALRFQETKYLHILAIGKYVDDGFHLDNDGAFSAINYWDVGAKVEMELNRFKLSYEYLKRGGEGDQYRSVGNITYQLSKTMSISGGFGKDFPLDDNLVSLLGINWGLNSGENPFGK